MDKRLKKNKHENRRQKSVFFLYLILRNCTQCRSGGYTKTVLVSLVVHKIMGIPVCLGAEQNTGEKIKSDKPRAIMPLGKLISGRCGNIAGS